MRRCDLLELDLSGVAEIDTAGFQLLLLVKREAKRLASVPRSSRTARRCVEVVDFFNMVAAFGDPMLMPAREQ